MNCDCYKTQQSSLDVLPSQIIENRTPNYTNQFQTLFHEKLQELIYYYENDIEKYANLCNFFSFSVAGDIPQELLALSEFFDIISFVCQVLNQTTDLKVLSNTLLFIPPIITKNSSTINDFEQNNIAQIIFQIIQDDDNKEIFKTCIDCISMLVDGTDNLDIYEAFMDFEILQKLADQSLEIKKSVVSFCTSVLNSCPPYYIYRDILISLGLKLYEFEDGYDAEFLTSLGNILKKCPTDVFKLFQSNDYDEDGHSFLYILSTWINPEFYCSTSLYVLKLFYTMIKYVKESISEILSCIQNFQTTIINVIKEGDPQIVSVSYKILCYIIRINNLLISDLFEQEAISFEIISQNIEEGDFCLRKSAIKLSKILLEYGSIYPETKIFYSTEYIDLITSVLDSDSEKLDLLILESFKMIAHKAVVEENDDIISAFQDQSILEMFDYINDKYEDNENIGICIEQILTIIPAFDET